MHTRKHRRLIVLRKFKNDKSMDEIIRGSKNGSQKNKKDS